MSLSLLRTPISGNCKCRSEKSDKILYHRAYRRRVRMAIRAGLDPLPHFREVSNVWTWGKDGKTYFGNVIVSDFWQPLHRMFGK